jgi:transposase
VSEVIIEAAPGDTTSHTTTRMTGRMTVIARVSGRRLWTVDQKLLMLRDAFGSGGEVRTAMERHEVSSDQLPSQNGLRFGPIDSSWRRGAGLA